MKNINLGKTGTDRITGFKGTITGYVEYYTGCNQFLLVPKCEKGKENTKPDGHWFDDNRIDIKDSKKIELIENKADGPDISPHTDWLDHVKVVV